MLKARWEAVYSSFSVRMHVRICSPERSGRSSVSRLCVNGWPETKMSASMIRLACAWSMRCSRRHGLLPRSNAPLIHGDEDLAEVALLHRARHTLAHQLKEREERHDQLELALLGREELKEPDLALHRDEQPQLLHFHLDGPRLGLDLVDRRLRLLEHLGEGAHEVGDANLKRHFLHPLLLDRLRQIVRRSSEVLMLQRVQLGEQLGHGLELLVLFEAPLQFREADRDLLVLLALRRFGQQPARLHRHEAAQQGQRLGELVEIAAGCLDLEQVLLGEVHQLHDEEVDEVELGQLHEERQGSFVHVRVDVVTHQIRWPVGRLTGLPVNWLTGEPVNPTAFLTSARVCWATMRARLAPSCSNRSTASEEAPCVRAARNGSVSCTTTSPSSCLFWAQPRLDVRHSSHTRLACLGANIRQ